MEFVLVAVSSKKLLSRLAVAGVCAGSCLASASSRLQAQYLRNNQTQYLLISLGDVSTILLHPGGEGIDIYAFGGVEACGAILMGIGNFAAEHSHKLEA